MEKMEKMKWWKRCSNTLEKTEERIEVQSKGCTRKNEYIFPLFLYKKMSVLRATRGEVAPADC